MKKIHKSGIHKMSYLQNALAMMLIGVSLIGCDLLGQPDSSKKAATLARAVLSPTEGNQVKGEVIFSKMNNGVRVIAKVEGLTPGPHGFHIHEHGDCSAPDGTSAGGHYNPTNESHGCTDNQKRHVGDLGNIFADEAGRAYYERVDHVISLTGKHGIIGKAVIIHEKADDCKSEPTGDAGGRLACGVIEELNRN
ncbi:MAG: superoxide dismutase family protein [Waddliaceae bacterium]